jgi:hypothetical protein
MTSMFIPRIFGASRIDRPGARRSRSPSSRRFALEPLEVRTAMSTGLRSGLAAMDSYRAHVAPAVIGSVHAAWMAQEAGVAVPATFGSAGAAPAASGTGMSKAAEIQLVAETYANLLPLVSDLLTGLAGSITLVGQAYRDGVPIGDLLGSIASTIGSTPAEIPSDLIPLGVAAASTAQEAGVALPATVAGLEGMAAGSQFDVEGWLPVAIGQIEALAAIDGLTLPNRASYYGPPPAVSTAGGGEGGLYLIGEASSGDRAALEPNPDAPPVPPGLISLGKFFLRNINIIYTSYVQYFDNVNIPDSLAARPDGIALNGLAPVSEPTAAAVEEAQDTGWVGAGWTAYLMAGGRGPACSQGAASRGGEVQSPDSSPEEPVPPAAITAGEIPLDVLLSDPELSAQGVSVGLQQVAELIPVEDSSLALIATLWSVPTDVPSHPSDDDDPSGEREESVPSSASPPPWAVFVIGLDDAFERSRDACGKALRDGARQEHEAAGDAAEGRLEWRCPIIPGPEGRRHPDRAAGDRAIPSGEADPNRPVPSRSSGGEEWVARPCPEHNPPHDAGDGQPLTEGTVPLAWAASGSALVAGWFWARRRLRRGWGLGRIGRRDQRRGGRDPFEGEGP